MTERVLVTGAGGFIGSHLVEALVAQGIPVRAMVRYQSSGGWGRLEALSPATRDALEVASGDITDAYFVRDAVEGCATVFHLAALIGIPYSYTAPQHYLNVNIQGTLNILEACRRAQTSRLVVTSTSETYGTARYTPIDEQHPLQGQSPYAASKISADKLAESYHLSFGLPVTVIRPFNAYGPRQSARAFLPGVIGQALAWKAGSQPAIQVGSLDPVRDLTYVTDTVAGFLSIAKADAAIGEVINIGAGQPVSMRALLALTLDLLEMPEAPVEIQTQRVRPVASEVRLLHCDASKAQRLLGWTPQVSLRDGILKMIEAFRQDTPGHRPQQYHI